MQKNQLLVLVDVDGTLISPGMTARLALAQAIFDFTGNNVTLESGQLAGMTDPMIVTNALKNLRIPNNGDGLPSKILKRYLEIFAHDFPAATDKKVYPGVYELLDFLKTLPVRLGLLTGNLRRGALIKLTPFDLWRHFDFGVFSDDSADRNELPPIALERVKSLFGENFQPEQTIVIGDTLNDVTCAHVNRMQALIVLRHPEWRTVISAEEPELLVESFEPLEPVKSWFEEYFRQD